LSTLHTKLEFDKQFGYPTETLAGIDEAGRGAWMGPVVAACVILPENFSIEGINDSKQIKKEDTRLVLAEQIKEQSLAYGIGFVHNHTIEEIGIQKANFRAFQLALEDMQHRFDIQPSFILLDGNYTNVSIPPYQSIKKGDSLSASIACASILAKTERDTFVSTVCHEEFPDYLFNKHKGYGVPSHQHAIRQHGLTKWHREYFCQKFLQRINGGETL
jgi:ribonuclease HII